MSLKKGIVHLEEYNYKWKDMYKEEEKRLKELLKYNVIEIMHVGSTSIEGLCAKPVIDIMVTVKHLEDVKKFKHLFIADLGYDFRDDGGVRDDFLHKLSTSIINENQVIVIENLDVKSMFQTKKIAKVLGDISISKFINMLEYKAKWYGRTLIKVNRYYPSSQLCNRCGYQNKELKDYSIRKWTCPKCKSTHNRDYNAANNILDKGLEMLFV